MVKFHLHVWQCCEALAATVSSMNGSPRCIVPGILFLESYFSCEDKSNWNWPKGIKMQIVGSLILQAVFRFPSVCFPLLPVFRGSLILSWYAFGCYEYKSSILTLIFLLSCVSMNQEFIQPYVTSITSMEADHVLEAAKDAAGARVIEAYLGSKVSAKQKHRVVLKYVMLLYLVI